MKQFYLLGWLVLGFQLAAAQAQTWQSKTDERLWQQENTTEPFEFLVQLAAAPPDLSAARLLTDKTEKGRFVWQRLHAHAEQTQAAVAGWLERQNLPHQRFWIANVIWVKADFETLKTLALRPDVRRISENSTLEMVQPVEMEAAAPVLNKNVTYDWGLLKIQADKVWNLGYRGQGVVIGGQDTGYEWTHEALKDRYRGWDGNAANHHYNWHDAIHDYNPMNGVPENPCGLDAAEPCDDHNHGTHTMGTMVGEMPNVKFGIAPDALWVGCRNMERGYGTPQTYLECFEWFLAPTDLNGNHPDPSKAPHVINNSWTCPEVEGCNTNNFNLLETAVNHLKAAGVVVVVSAGNSGSNCGTIATPPAIFENSFSIGAMAQNDTIAGFSSRGMVTIDGSNRLKPNVAAPGVWVYSAIRNNGYAHFSGTSMAGPHVAGLVALLISADPTLAGDVERIETIIEQTTVPRTLDVVCGGVSGLLVPNPIYGYGSVDALAAVTYALENKGSVGEASFRIYPNPVDATLFVQLIGVEGTVRFSMYAAHGALVKSEVLDFSGGNKIRPIEVEGLAAGVYFYQICHATDCYEGKIVVY